MEFVDKIVSSESPESAAEHLEGLREAFGHDDGAVEAILLSFVFPEALKNGVGMDVLSVCVEQVSVSKYWTVLRTGCKYGNTHLVAHMLNIGARGGFHSALTAIDAGSPGCLFMVVDSMLDNDFEAKKDALMGHAVYKGAAECVEVLQNL